MLKKERLSTINCQGNRIALPDKNGLVFYDITRIVRCHSDNSYTDFYMLNENNNGDIYTKVVISKGFDYFEDFLVSKGLFYRVHNQHIINIYHINRYIKNDGGYLVLNVQPEVKIPVARARRAGFLKHLKEQGILL